MTVPISAGLLTQTDRYFDALSEYRTGNPAPIVERVANATFAALENGRRLINDLRDIRSDWATCIKARRGAKTWVIADVLFRHPVVNAPLVAAQAEVALPNVYRSLAPLAEAGVLVAFTDKKRNQLWRAPDILNALDAFAARAGRRTPG